MLSLQVTIFFVNQVPFFATISKNIKLTTTQYLKDQKASTILSVISKVQALYTKRGFAIRQTLMNRELEPLQDDLNCMQIDLNTTAANEHVPLIEQQIQVIKEQVRAMRHSMPFWTMPMIMLVKNGLHHS